MDKYIVFKSKNYKNIFKYLYSSILLIKISLLAWSAHPFDFWAFVTIFQRNTLYNWSLFDNWNKGNLLIILWGSIYSLYLKLLEVLSIKPDHILLLHALFKIPFLWVDIISGYIIYLILLKITSDKKKSLLGLLFWSINPIIFYTYGVHGHYELIVPFSLLLLIYGLLISNVWYLAIGLTIAFTTKYFIIIILPFILLYLVFTKKNKLILFLFITSMLLLTISYLHLFTNNYLQQTLSSILTLSQTNAPAGESLKTLSPLTIISMVHTFLNNDSIITNLSNPMLFILSQKFIFVGLISIIFFILLRFINILKIKKYTFEIFLLDILVTIIIFLLSLSNFQPHYISWILPLLIICGILRTNILVVYSGLSVVGIMYLLRSEYGFRTFFLDILSSPNIGFLGNTGNVKYFEGAIVVFLLLLCLLAIKLKNKSSSTPTFIILYSQLLIWLIIITQYIYVFNTYIYQNDKPNKLSFGRESIHRGIIYATYPPKKIYDDKIVLSSVNKYPSLVIPLLLKLNTADKNNFSAYLILGENDGIDNKLSGGSFYLNTCPIREYRKDLLNYSNNKLYSGYLIDISCIKTENNISYPKEWASSIPLYKDLSLYIYNKNVDYLYLESERRRINIGAVIGGLFILIFISSSFVVIRRMFRAYSDQDRNNKPL